MQEVLISFETAKLAQEKGFELDKYLSINNENPKNLNSNYNPRDYQPWYFDLTQSLLQKWLREVHKIHLVVWWRDQEDMFYYEMGSKSVGMIIIQSGDGTKLYKTYEEALECGIYQALKLINN